MTTLARETGLDIISTEAGLRSVRTRVVAGTMSVRDALHRLLEDTGYHAVASAGGYRVVKLPRRAMPPPRPAAPPAATPTDDIVVTASKQQTPLLRYPGSLTVIGALPVMPSQQGADMTQLAHAVPILQSTQLGAGRNKVFIRGIADSSFNGSTQSPASLYLDDVQLNYAGPDPGLRLYDMRSVEILEGPQGTLYGAGSIGGVIRMTSNPTDLARTAASLAGGVTATRGGAPGYDIAGMINLPIVTARLGLRAVGYAIRDGGYIDDAGLGQSNVNRSDTIGGRVALRLDLDDGWRVEASGAGQRIDTRDAQYAESIGGPLARRSRIAQPFANDILFGRVMVAKAWDSGLRFVTATGIVGYRSTDQFDATPRPGPDGSAALPTVYIANRSKLLLTHETRLSRTLPNGRSWVAGIALIGDQDRLSRSLGSPGSDLDIIGVTNTTQAASLFGEATIGILPGLSITGGARATTARTDGNPSNRPRSSNFVKGRSTQRLDPTLALSWQLAPKFALFARFQSGYRTGGLAVASGVGRVADYQSDEIVLGEIGLRKLRTGASGIAFSGSVSVARWSNIQADLTNRRGQPYTANIGDARIEAFEGNVEWVPLPGLQANGSVLFADTSVSGPVADLSRRNNHRLPETPPFAAHGGLSYQWRMPDMKPRMAVTADFTGRSVLGTGDLLDVSQGNYFLVGASAGLTWRRFDFSLSGDNLTNSTANRFAFGNPFSMISRDQATPLRPLNVRFGLGVAW